MKLPARLERSSSELSPSSELSFPSPESRDLRSPLWPRRLRLGARPMLFQLERRLVQLLPALQGLCGELRALGCRKGWGQHQHRATHPCRAVPTWLEHMKQPREPGRCPWSIHRMLKVLTGDLSS